MSLAAWSVHRRSRKRHHQPGTELGLLPHNLGVEGDEADTHSASNHSPIDVCDYREDPAVEANADT